MKRSDHTKESAPSSADAALRRAMQGALAQTHAKGLEDLQMRVLAQWDRRNVSAVAVEKTARGILHWGLTPRDIRLGLAALILLAAVGLQVTRMQSELPMDDLLEPDVLSLMAMGEL